MPAQIVSSTAEKVVLQLELPLSGSMLIQEEQIPEILNQAGMLFTGEALQSFDSDGSPLIMGQIKWTSKGPEPKHHQTPYG